MINAGIDDMTADGKTSIFEVLQQLFADDGRAGAAKIVLLLSDAEQTVDTAPNKTLSETVVDSARSSREMASSCSRGASEVR